MATSTAKAPRKKRTTKPSTPPPPYIRSCRATRWCAVTIWTFSGSYPTNV